MDRISASIPRKKFPKPVNENENKYWTSYKPHFTSTEFSAVTDVEYSLLDPYDLLVTSSTRLQVYEAYPSTEIRSMGRFKDVVYSGTYRPDGKLISAGTANGGIHIVDPSRKATLRIMKGHTAATRCVRFSSDNSYLFSGSNDATVRYWDISTETELGLKSGHLDHVRCGQASGTTPTVFVSGSYDHTVKVWDWRESSNQALLTIDHGAPVESLLISPKGTLIYTAGSNYVCIWDILAGGRMIHKFSHHQKTITSIRMDSTNSMLYSAGLDQIIVAHDPQSYNLVGVLECPHPILSFDLTPNSSGLAVGMSNGSVQVYAKPLEDKKSDSETPSNSHQFFLRGKGSKPTIITPGGHITQRITAYEQYLRKCKYREALDAALQNGNQSAVLSLVEELRARKGLNEAIGGRTEVTLIPLLQFIQKNISDPVYSHQVVSLCDVVLDTYGGTFGRSKTIDHMLLSLRNRVQHELAQKQEMYSILGIMDALMASATETPPLMAESFN